MKKKRIINICLLVIWMILIFIMSSFESGDSSSQSNFITRILVNLFNIENVSLVSLIVRKLAHLLEFFVLGVLSFRVFKDFKVKGLFLVSLIFCIIYASTDEIHQLFVPGRSGMITDVLIDSVGSLLGIITISFRVKK